MSKARTRTTPAESEWIEARETPGALRLGGGLWMLAYLLNLFSAVARELVFATPRNPPHWRFIPYWLNAPSIEAGCSQVVYFFEAVFAMEIVMAIGFIAALLFALSCGLLGSVRRGDDVSRRLGRAVAIGGFALLGICIIAHIAIRMRVYMLFHISMFSVLALLEAVLGVLVAAHLRVLFGSSVDRWLSTVSKPLLWAVGIQAAARVADLMVQAGDPGVALNYVIKATCVASGLGFFLVMLRLWSNPPAQLEPLPSGNV